MNQSLRIPAEALRLADNGDLIGAIKITREQTNLGLKEAKDAIDPYLHGRKATHPLNAGIPLQAVLSLQEGNFIDAVRQTREASGQGLKESKDAVETYLSTHPAVLEQYRAKRRGRGWQRLIVPLGLVIIVVFVAWWLLFGH